MRGIGCEFSVRSREKREDFTFFTFRLVAELRRAEREDKDA